MATRKKASSTSSRAGSKSTKRAAPAKTTRRKVRPSASAANQPDQSRASAKDDDVDEDQADGDARDDIDEDDPPPVATRPRAVQRSVALPVTAAPAGSRAPHAAPPVAARAPTAAGAANRPPPAAATPLPPLPASPARAGSRPFVVARGEDTVKVFAETLRHAGFYEAVENAQIKSGKRRELFEVACKVDFMRGVRRENEPVSYVDPKLVGQLFSGLLDRGFRILRVVETRGELSRYLCNRAVKQVGNALGYDESCYELKDLADDLSPLDLGSVGKRPTGRTWKQADFRIVFAKNRTDEHWGPALVLWNLWHVMATPSDLLSLEYGMDAGDVALTLLEKLPVHFALIDAVHSRDGAPGTVFPYETLKAIDAAAPDSAQQHRLGWIVAGSDPLAVEAAGHKLQGLDPQVDPMCLRKLRKLTGWKSPAEAEALPTYPGWRGVGNRIREAIGADKPVDAVRLALFTAVQQADPRLFPPIASAYGAIRLRQKVEVYVDELRRRHGVRAGAVVGTARASPISAAAHPQDESDDGQAGGAALDDDGDPPTFH
ncbi:MAG: hypothetical protein EXS13_00015 [Planctomycetes bacterium]|nr:hypothetical protein [Planctomycetota bacterium]